MKWFFTLSNQIMKDFELDVRKMLISNNVNKRISLEPYCLFPDDDDDCIQELVKEFGITVIKHKHRLNKFFSDFFSGYSDSQYLRTANCTFLRTEIPYLCELNGWPDEYVLYTDYDVIFINDCYELSNVHPELFAAAPEQDINNKEYFNAGIMIMNIKNMNNSDMYESFCELVRTKIGDYIKIAFDQSALNEFYAGKFNPLDPIFNWKPYWNINEDAKIVHFHGIKSNDINPISDRIKNNKLLLELYEANSNSINHYYKIYESIR